MNIEPIELFFDTVERLIEGFIAHLPQFALALLALLLTLGVARLLRSVIAGIMIRAKVRRSLVRLAANLIGIASWIAGASIAITIIFPSVTPAQLIAGLGLTSVAIGFAFKDVFENFLAGVIILFRKKMRIGDIIECDGVYGEVEDISVRETHVRKPSGELVIAPNAHLFKNPLEIKTDEARIRQELTVGVDYDTDLGDVEAVLAEVLAHANTVAADPAPEVACVAFGGSSIDFKLLWWAKSDPRSQRRSYHDVALAVKAAFDERGVSIPFPQTTLSFRDGATPIAFEAPDRAANDAAE